MAATVLFGIVGVVVFAIALPFLISLFSIWYRKYCDWVWKRLGV